MKIDARKIAPEGLILTEEFSPGALDLDAEIIKVSGPIKVRASVSKSYNAIEVLLSVSIPMVTCCSRCLKEIATVKNKEIELDFVLDKLSPVIDLDPDIREEIILDYPMKPLCKDKCLGLCFKCGKNLNEEKCICNTKPMKGA